jgi:hypothetical protein
MFIATATYGPQWWKHRPFSKLTVGYIYDFMKEVIRIEPKPIPKKGKK